MLMSPSLGMQIVLWALTFVVLAGAILVVALGNLFRAALSLGVVLVGVAGLFLLLQAEFLAFVQILVYVGAILTLVVFAVMLIPPPIVSAKGRRSIPPPLLHRGMEPAAGCSTGGGMTARVQGPSISSGSPNRLPAAVASLALFILLAGVTQALTRSIPTAAEVVTLQQLGRELVTTLVLPFEVISVVFVASMVGAIAIAASKTPDRG